MKTRTKVIISIIAVLLSSILAATIVMLTYGKSVNSLIRTVEVQRTGIDIKSNLSSYENPQYNTQGTTTYFRGTKILDIRNLSNIDKINMTKDEQDELKEINNTVITYNYQYDNETNKININIKLQFKDGKILEDAMDGVGFINENNELDAVLNLDNKAVLLSQLRNYQVLDNCAFALFVGLFAALTFGAAWIVTSIMYNTSRTGPSIIGGNLGFGNTMVGPTLKPGLGSIGGSSNGSGSGTSSGSSTTNKPITSYSSLTAALAAGVPMSSALCEQFYPGIGATEEKEATTGKNILTAKWIKIQTKRLIKQLIIAALGTNSKDPEVYVHVMGYNKAGPTVVNLLKLYSKDEMQNNMKLYSWSSFTYAESLAKGVVKGAFESVYPNGYLDKHVNINLENIFEIAHYHWVNPDTGSLSGVTGLNGLYRVHSFYGEILGVEL